MSHLYIDKNTDTQVPYSLVPPGADSYNQQRLERILLDVGRKQATGRLTIVADGHRWHLFFDLGQFVYASGSFHRMRRWQRSLQQVCPRVALDDLSPSLKQPWEYHLLATAVYCDRLTVEEGKAIAIIGLREILFAICRCEEMTWGWDATPPIEHAYPLDFWLSATELEEVLRDTARLYKQWRTLGLDPRYADYSPILTEADQTVVFSKKSSVFSGMHQLLDGQHTFWDLTIATPSPLSITTRILHHFVQQGVVVFREVPDLPPPAYLAQTDQPKSSPPTPTAPLIACIDDCEQVCKLMERILTRAGYRFLGIRDPLQALPTLLEAKPDFIFLDLIMPVVNGYELCKQLRRVGQFHDTPITMLTGQDGLLDRVRANLVGATDFMSKPINPEAILDLVHSYLQPHQTTLPLVAVETALEEERSPNHAPNHTSNHAPNHAPSHVSSHAHHVA